MHMFHDTKSGSRPHYLKRLPGKLGFCHHRRRRCLRRALLVSFDWLLQRIMDMINGTSEFKWGRHVNEADSKNGASLQYTTSTALVAA